MTRKDYINFANRLSDACPTDKTRIGYDYVLQQWEIDVDMIADAFQADNPRFDRARFIDACQPA